MGKLKVAFRVDGHAELGMGHLMRCLALARSIKEKADSDILFITKGNEETIKRIFSEGHRIKSIPIGSSKDEESALAIDELKLFKPAVIITDLPYTTADFLKELKKLGRLLVSIDDLALVTFCSDLVTSGYLSAKLKKYKMTNPAAKLFIGADYLMLNKKFEEMNKKRRKIIKNARSTLVTLGGADPANLTAKVVKALCKINKKLKVTLVLGPAYVHNRELLELLNEIKDSKPKFVVKSNVKEMTKLMMEADVAITAGGETIYELAATGTPAINISHVEHQSINARELERKGVVINLGLGKDVSEEQISSTVEYLLEDNKRRQKMSARGKKLVDGKGAKRVAELILATLGEVSKKT